MAHLDICEPPSGLDPSIRYLIILQSDVLSPLRTTIVAPLRAAANTPDLGRLTPRVKVKGRVFAVSVTELVSLQHQLLGPVVANAKSERVKIINALDMVFTGV
jgi:hypothetical protein